MKYVKFYLTNGYVGISEQYEVFDDDVTDKEIDEWLAEASYENAEEYESSVDHDDWGDEDYEDYYENALIYSSWDYITEEEYNEGIGNY